MNAADVRIAVLVMTDGRDEYLLQSVRSAMDSLSGPITEWWMHDDTGDAAYRADLERRYPTFRHIHSGPRCGFGAAIASAWTRLATASTADYVFHLEADFVFTRPVDLADLVEVLDARPQLAQMALVRQAWNAQEQAAGGVIACHPESYHPARDDTGRLWLEHTLFWTTNPSLYRRQLCTLGWPDGKQSEGHFTRQLLQDGMGAVPGPLVRFGYWGRTTDGPWVEHIGVERKGHGY
jgi:hypothetical protein